MRHIPRSSQNGSALIISLIMLAAVTLLSVSSIRNSTMQERMASAEQDLLNTFFSAESVVFSLNSQLNGDSTNLQFADAGWTTSQFETLCGRSVMAMDTTDDKLPWKVADGASGLEGSSSKKSGFDKARDHAYLLIPPPVSCVNREEITTTRMGAARTTEFYWLVGKGGSGNDAAIFALYSTWK